MRIALTGATGYTGGWLLEALLRRGDAVMWLQADLCRSELLVEIEAVLTRAPAQREAGA